MAAPAPPLPPAPAPCYPRDLRGYGRNPLEGVTNADAELAVHTMLALLDQLAAEKR